MSGAAGTHLTRAFSVSSDSACCEVHLPCASSVSIASDSRHLTRAAVSLSPAPVVEYISPAPAVSSSPAPVVEYISPAPAVFHAPSAVEFPARVRAEVRGGRLQGSVTGQSSTARRGDDLPLPSGWPREEEDDEFEEEDEEDDDLDETDVAQSRFPAGFPGIAGRGGGVCSLTR